MTAFGLDPGELRTLVEAVVPRRELDDGAVADAFARAAWTVIAEPGDGDAGALIAARGAAGALGALLETAAARGRGAEHGAPGSAIPAAEAVGRWTPRLRSADVERALRLAARLDARLLVPPSRDGGGEAWPCGVDGLGAHAPVALWARGDAALLGAGARPGVALVGARAATAYGEHIAGELAAGAVGRGLSVVSGAAYGVDGMAHRAALASDGDTVAFLAGGIDRFYPAGHDELLHRIVRHGLVVSELPCGAAPTRWRFLHRNMQYPL